MTAGKIYKFSAYYFKGGKLYWLYDSKYEYDPNFPLIERSLDVLSHHGIKPTLLTVDRGEDIIAYHYYRGKWRLYQEED